MKRTKTIIIGGGQAGLAMSRGLSERRIPHCHYRGDDPDGYMTMTEVIT